MEVFAWTGVGIGAVILAIVAVIWLANMLRHPFGRAILVGWSIIAVAVWAAVGGVWLLWEHGG